MQGSCTTWRHHRGIFFLTLRPAPAATYLQDCPDRLVIAPDCGLKTRNWAEVIPALRNMVQAAHIMRQRLGKAPAAGAQHVHAGNGACGDRNGCC